jgi:hypothetical protein
MKGSRVGRILSISAAALLLCGSIVHGQQASASSSDNENRNNTLELSTSPSWSSSTSTSTSSSSEVDAHVLVPQIGVGIKEESKSESESADEGSTSTLEETAANNGSTNTNTNSNQAAEAQTQVIVMETVVYNAIVSLEEDDESPHFAETTLSNKKQEDWMMIHDIDSMDTNTNITIMEVLEGDSCMIHESCQECYGASSTCHWCDHDGTCHVKGSVYGCLRGQTCSDDPAPVPSPTPPAPTPSKPTRAPSKHKKKPAKASCSDHGSCSECALSSLFCHWCGYDNQCHSVGSVHGCTSGVNCYANKRCHRTEPETVYDTVWNMSVSPLLIIYCVVSCAMMLCCYTCCFCGVKATKGAYEDIILNTAAATADVVLEQQSLMSRANSAPIRIGSTIRTAPISRMQSIEERDGASQEEGQSSGSVTREQRHQDEFHPDAEADPDPDASNTDKQTTEDNNVNVRYQSQSVDQWENLEDPMILMPHQPLHDETSELSQTLLPKAAYNGGRYYSSSGGRGDTTRASTILSRKSYRDSLKSRNTQCLLGCCSLMYTVAMLWTIAMSVATFMYFPRMPTYTVCNNEFDWKSIVEGMTSAKLEAEFELLLSIHNPNRVGVDLVMGSGSFSHDGTYIGRFDIPAHTEIRQQSISDVLVTITLKPDKWEALALTTEYYRGILAFSVDTAVTVSAPALLGYTYQAKFGNVLVHVSADAQGDDRSLCACPQWKDEKKKSKPNNIPDWLVVES